MAVATKNCVVDIQHLIVYSEQHRLIQKEDRLWCYNALLEMLSFEGPAPILSWNDIDTDSFNLEQTLLQLARIAVSQNITENTQSGEDSFAMRVMGLLMPKPSEVSRHFYKLYQDMGPQAATSWFYELCCDAGYVRRSAIAKNISWSTKTSWGDLEITINLSKPEKDPREIATAKKQASSDAAYPACQLCLENEGYAGRSGSSSAGAHPARQNLRIIPLELNHHRWGFQYSPYAYFTEHSIVMNSNHIPMHIDQSTFTNLLDFVDQFPHYFIGSNADLPIVGGSILSHDHYQAGHYEFPMMRASISEDFTLKDFPSVEGAVLKWPLSVLRLRSQKRKDLIAASTYILDIWRAYSDESISVLAESHGEQHNTITPIVRKLNDVYEIYLTLRCNLTSTKHPLGIFHPHSEYHHIKKENIGLIEVMGLAILPPRLVNELEKVHTIMYQGLTNEAEANTIFGQLTADPITLSHAEWSRAIYQKLLDKGASSLSSNELKTYVYDEVGLVFSHVLENAGVFKWDTQGREAQRRFITSL